MSGVNVAVLTIEKTVLRNEFLMKSKSPIMAVSGELKVKGKDRYFHGFEPLTPRGASTLPLCYS